MNNSRVASLTSPGEAWAKHLRKVSQGIVKTHHFPEKPGTTLEWQNTYVAPRRLRNKSL